MVVAPLAIQAEREMVMDFVYPFFTDYNTVLLKLPDPAETKWKTLIQPFKTEVRPPSLQSLKPSGKPSSSPSRQR